MPAPVGLSVGWAGIDPANRCCPDTRHLRTGSGCDAPDAAPIPGVAAGAAQGALRVDLRVGPVGEGETMPLPMPMPPPRIAASGPLVPASGPAAPHMQDSRKSAPVACAARSSR